MKFLLDMNLSPNWLSEFQRVGIEAVHWSLVGNVRASDKEIMIYAREYGYIVFTHDLDFGAMLAATQATSPSVIQIQIQDISPNEEIAKRFFSSIEKYKSQLMEGALIVIDSRKNRVRILPLKL